MNINVHIEHLVLEGIDLTPDARAELKAAVETELARLVAERKVPSMAQTGQSLHTVPTQNLQLTDTRDPASLGRQIARSVYGGLSYGQSTHRTAAQQPAGDPQQASR